MKMERKSLKVYRKSNRLDVANIKPDLDLEQKFSTISCN